MASQSCPTCGNALPMPIIKVDTNGHKTYDNTPANYHVAMCGEQASSE